MKQVARLALLFGITVVSGQALAEGTIRAKAIYGSATYEVDKRLAGMDRPAESDFTVTGVGLAYVGSGNGFISLDVRSSGSDATHNGYFGAEQKFEHTDWTITGGTVTNSGLTFFVGMTGAENTMHHTPTLNKTWTKDELSTLGFFLGMSKSWSLGESGQLGAVSLNGSVGGMQGDWKDDAVFSVEGASALGFSVGAGYQIFFSKHLGLSVDVKQQSYSWDFETATATLPKFKEKISSTTVALIGQF